MSIIKELSEMLGIGRLMDVYNKKHRREMAQMMAGHSDGVTQVTWRDRLIEFEDKMLGEIEGEIPEEMEPMLRIQVRDILIDHLAEQGDSDE